MTQPSDSLQRLLAEAPFVQQLARALLAEEADDVVQQTWLRAIRDGGDEVAAPRSWLARILRNVTHNMRRSRARRERHEHAAAPGMALVPSSADLLLREERRRELVEAVDGLPDALRTVLLLRFFEGLPPRDIAARLRLPVSTIWNRQREALQCLRDRLDASHGEDRRAWLLPLVSTASAAEGPASLSGRRAAWSGAQLAAATLVITVCGTLTLWTATACVAEPTKTADVAAAAPPSMATSAAATSPEVAPARVPIRSAAAAGELVVHVRHVDDHSPVVAAILLLQPFAGDPRVDTIRRGTDAAGSARFDGLATGRYRLVTDRWDEGQTFEFDAGKGLDLQYELAIGQALAGIVVDRDGAPVADAEIDLAPVGSAQIDAQRVAASGLDGRFTIRGAPLQAFVGARAASHRSSLLHSASASAGVRTELRLQLDAPGGTVAGMVVDRDGRPIPRAILRIGAGQTSMLGSVRGHAPVPVTVHTDEAGAFRAIGVAVGQQPVVARAAGKATWRGQCTITENAVASLRIELLDGATLRGSVRDSAGGPVAAADIAVGDRQDLAFRTATSGPDGTYEIGGLDGGELALAVQHRKAGRCNRTVTTIEGAITKCDLQLSRGTELRGRIVDEAGAPVRARLDCMTAEGMPFGIVSSDAEGRFVATNCPPDTEVKVTVRATGFEPLTRAGIDPTAGDLELRLVRAARASVRIRGQVVDERGTPSTGARVVASDRKGSRDPALMQLTDSEGRFEIGPVPPGHWRITVGHSRHPTRNLGERELAADAVWDLERITLVDGGTVRVRADGDLAAVAFVVVDAKDQSAGHFSSRGPTPLTSGPLAPGSYRLLVVSQTMTADPLPFTVKAGEQCEVSVQLHAGVRQRIELVGGDTVSPPAVVTLRVHRDAELVTVATCALRSGRGQADLCLRVGDYRITAIVGDRELATAALRVAAAESATLQMKIQ